MIDTTDWQYCYKLGYKFAEVTATNMLYTPKMNAEGNIMCMSWDAHDPYQSENTRITDELIDFFFQREVVHLQVFKDYPWAPKIIEIDMINKKVFIEWNTETCNHIIMGDNRKTLDEVCPDWKEQLFTILKDITDAGYYKMALYPHCFFLDEHNKLKTFDFYSCISSKERYLELSKIEGMIGELSVERFSRATTNGIIDFDVFFKETLLSHLGNQWPVDPFPEFYNKIFNG